MTEYVARCESSDRDKITADRDASKVRLLAEHSGECKMDAFLSPDKARAFANGITALANEIDGGGVRASSTSDPVRVGDEVVIVRADSASYVGRYGTVTEVDRVDTDLPYYVSVTGGFGQWVAEVRKVTAPVVAPSSSREAYVTRAKGLLPGAVDADVIRLAEFLAGE
ncbi:hypothetical protein [Streptomyces niveus]|uniref:hypothetical protein n=1 Tax=Streptomyces niveus TaxID=193462 RepID=UPI003661F918